MFSGTGGPLIYIYLLMTDTFLVSQLVTRPLALLPTGIEPDQRCWSTSVMSVKKPPKTPISAQNVGHGPRRVSTTAEMSAHITSHAEDDQDAG